MSEKFFNQRVEIKNEKGKARFEVAAAHNPWYRALSKAGISDDLNREYKDITIDFSTEIEEQADMYRRISQEGTYGLEDDFSKAYEQASCLTEWADDVERNKKALLERIAKDADNISQRIDAGMIPIVMPSRSVQLKNWKDSIESLRPICIKDGVQQQVGKAEIEKDFARYMNENDLFRNIPEEPYVFWAETREEGYPYSRKKTFFSKHPPREDMALSELKRKNPSLHQRHMTPLEYAAFQALYTRKALEEFKKREHDVKKMPKNILPFNHHGTFLGILKVEKDKYGYVDKDNTATARFSLHENRLVFCLDADCADIDPVATS